MDGGSLAPLSVPKVQLLLGYRLYYVVQDFLHLYSCIIQPSRTDNRGLVFVFGILDCGLTNAGEHLPCPLMLVGGEGFRNYPPAK